MPDVMEVCSSSGSTTPTRLGPTTDISEDVVEGFRWLGLDWDEGIEVGGPHGTYRQSDRFGRRREVAERFVEAGRAYYDFRSAEELNELRARARREKKAPGYYIRRPPDSGPEDGRRRMAAGDRGVVRFSTPGHAVEFTDLVRGTVRFEPDAIDDFVILRSDGSPTYHLASTVDDVDYRITHVARGEDLLSSTPKHILMTEALSAERPVYAHLPLLFGPDGRKLSKRHGDTALRSYREGGYLAAAVFNYMSLLGWSLDPENEIFSRDQAVAAFRSDRRPEEPGDLRCREAGLDERRVHAGHGQRRLLGTGSESGRGRSGAEVGRRGAGAPGHHRPAGPGADQADDRDRSGGAVSIRRHLLRRESLAQGH